MKKIIYLIIVLLFVSTLWANEKVIFKKVRIDVESQADITILTEAGFDFEGAFYEKNQFIDLIVSEYEIEKIENTGFNYSVEIEDLSKFYASRLYNRVGKGFGYGSMGGYYTFDEVNAQLDSMYAQYPNLITEKASIGSSTLGRPIYAVQISNNPGSDDGDPEMLFTALHHAREPQGMMAVLYYMWHLLENYGTDAEATDLIDNRQIWIIPVVNPDGYVHNEETDPSGGGNWRKNGSDNNNDGVSFGYNDGVDLNRNYGYEWGDQWSGSSSDPSSNTYRGPSAFSEPELQAVRDFCNIHQFRAALNYHTYSNLLLYPYGYDDVACEDDEVFEALAAEMTIINNYTIGRPATAIGYTANGSSDDWMYGEQLTKPKIFAFTPEVGSSYDGFWPATDRIIPLAEENLYMNYYITKAIGCELPEIKNLQIITYGQNNAIEPGETAEISFNLANNGFEVAAGLTARIISPDTMINNFDQSIDLAEVAAFSEYEDTQILAFQLNYNCEPGETKNILVGIFDGETMLTTDTLSFVVSAIEIIYFSDDVESGDANWNVDSPWGITSSDYNSPAHSFTDSPGSEYNSSIDVSLTSAVIDLQNVPSATLQYYTKWDIEDSWDFGVVEISTDAGSSWNNLQGAYMEEGDGHGAQETGEYGYDDISSGWMLEEIALNDYVGNNVQIRFRLKTDGSVTEDGWYVDDIKIKVDSISMNKPPHIISVTHLDEIHEDDLPLTVTVNVEDDSTFMLLGHSYYTNELNSLVVGWLTWMNGYSFTINPSEDLDTIYYYVNISDDDSAWTFYPYNCSFETMQQNALKTAIIRSTDIEDGNTKITDFKLLGNYPNPFNPETQISYQLPKASNVELTIYNSLGQKIKALNIKHQPAGTHQLRWDGKNSAGYQVSSGVYLYRLKAGDNAAVGKMILMK